MVVPPRSQRCLKHSEHKQRSSGARRPMQRIDPRSVSPGIKPQRQTWLASSRAESGRADYPMCENTGSLKLRVESPSNFAYLKTETTDDRDRRTRREKTMLRPIGSRAFSH